LNIKDFISTIVNFKYVQKLVFFFVIEKALNKLHQEKNQQKSEFELQMNENKLTICELNHKLEQKNSQIADLNDRIVSLNDYKAVSLKGRCVNLFNC
jgi:hypothetical protein